MKKFLGIVLALLVLLGVGGEFGARWYVGQQLKSSTGVADSSIGFGSSPLLVGIVRQQLPEVTLDVPAHGDNPGMKAYITDLNLSDPDNPVAGTMRTEATISQESMLAQLQSAQAQQEIDTAAGDIDAIAQAIVQELLKVTGLGTDAAAGTLLVEMQDGNAVITLKPVVADNTVTFDVIDTQIFGFSLPQQVSDALSSILAGSTDSFNTENLTITNLVVVDGGMNITLEGTNVPLSEI